MATCPASYDWAKNIQGQDPCEVASQLLVGDCNEARAPLQPIPSGEQYASPIAGSKCGCSGPIYALVSACADCQAGRFVDWDEWSLSCNPIFAQYPLHTGSGTSIPKWAQSFNIDVPNAKFDREAAIRVARGDEPSGTDTNTSLPSSSVPSPSINSSTLPQSTTLVPSSLQSTSLNLGSTTTYTRSSIDFSLTLVQTGVYSDDAVYLTTPQATDALSTNIASTNNDKSGNNSTAVPDSEQRRSNNAGATAGGVIGALIGLALLGVTILWFLRRRRRSRIAPSAAYLAAYGSRRPGTAMSQGPFDRTASIVEMSQANSIPSYHDEEPIRESIYSAGRTGTHYNHAPVSIPGYR